MTRAFVAVGSNIAPEKNVREAVRRLSRRARVEGISTVYRTAPLGRPEQDPYYNCVVAVETALPPLAFRDEVLRAIETELGRVRSADTFAPRTIDLDLIFYGALELRSGTLALPDPEIARRPFLAVPFAELAPDAVIPGLARSAAELAAEMSREGMEALEAYTEDLRKELRHGDESRAR